MTGRPNGPHGDRHVVIIGAGGNIGSHLVPHIARMPEIARLTLIDPDRYEQHNVHNQAIVATCIGRRKVQVQASVARRINPWLEIRALAETVESAPAGMLRGDVILACLDSRRARQYVNQIATRLGVRWIDAGVLADGLLVRIDTFLPGPDAACQECGWDAHDYAAIEQTYPCGEGEVRSIPSNAPAGLGALAAALQALECARLLAVAAQMDAPAAGEQIVIGVGHRSYFRTARRRNPDCRLGSHEPWTIGSLALDTRTATLRDLFTALAHRTGTRDDIVLRIDGKYFVKETNCAGCGATRKSLQLSAAVGTRLPKCDRCHSRMSAAGSGVTERVQSAALTTAELRRSLHAIGIRAAEVLTVETSAGELHFELSDRGAGRRATRTKPKLTRSVS